MKIGIGVVFIFWCFFGVVEIRAEHKGQAADSSAIFPFALSESPQFSTYIFEKNLFTPKECEAIIKLGRSLEKEEGKIGESDESTKDSSIRKSKVSWIGWNQDSDWIFQRLYEATLRINKQYFQFDLSGFFEKIQFTEYDAPDGHYTWHEDSGVGELSNRKLSIVVQLSDPKDYKGGELQFFVSGGEKSLEKAKGGAVFFPSYMPHRVTSITKGKRYSLVVWVSGPPFR